MKIKHKTRIAQRMYELSITQIELAEKADIAQSRMSQIQNGLTTPLVTTALRIADALDTRVEDLW